MALSRLLRRSGGALLYLHSPTLFFPLFTQRPKLGFPPSPVVVALSTVAPVFLRSRWCGGGSAVVAVSTGTGCAFGCLQRGT
ncbi:hypothetical protein L1987_05355 [Smallanthus sonchifolius]|uniref:Uncharacterized protein n=1 Tax=Smallanthus sonchifolius TaxID=185202 RepID=A0ACB9JVB1_9ASTR|nr:hypothetical protein L1987_05355 [Smallanthus sonchifolius]